MSIISRLIQKKLSAKTTQTALTKEQNGMQQRANTIKELYTQAKKNNRLNEDILFFIEKHTEYAERIALNDSSVNVKTIKVLLDVVDAILIELLSKTLEVK